MTARKPTELKKALGNPGKRAIPKALSVVARAPADTDPPATLGDVGAAEWRRTLTVCPWIGPSDLSILRLYCEALDRRSSLIAYIADTGTVLYTDRGYAYLNPAQSALNTTEAQITRWMSSLGLTPSDRGRLGVAEVKAQSALERIRADRARTVG